MNFYEHQDRAERRTKIIVFLFVVAVICIIAIVVVPVGLATQWSPGSMGATALACVLIVGIATFVKLSQLRSGGQSVAEMLGGSLLQREGSTRAERRVQNIVEEMAIASGMPVPPVYIIEDDGINAFAAGWSPNDAVIGVTRGCIEQLTRDELQGVIAHEFSHIGHGDMRINIRLIGIIFGIMALGITGWILVLYVGPAILRSSSRSRSKEGAGGAGIGLGIIVFGLFLALCGAIGTFFGRLIQAAVSRQREFLADASAVQYTRNPLGIGGALRKIGGMTPLKKITSEVGQCNHMFFSQAMNAVFASHPPIAQRIARVEGIDVGDLEAPGQQQGKTVNQASGVSQFSSSAVRDSIGGGLRFGAQHMQLARQAIDAINPTVRLSLNSGWGARLVMFALIADQNQQAQLRVSEILSAQELTTYKTISSCVEKGDPITRLPMIDLAAPSLRTLSPEQLKTFNKDLLSIIKSDGVIDRFEWVLVSVLQKHTSDAFGKKQRKTKGKPLSTYASDLSIVIATLAFCGTNELKEAKAAFQKSMDFLNVSVQMPSFKSCTMDRINAALKNLIRLRFVDKQICIEACELCVTHDNKITVVEAETLRAIGDVLDCPIPMFT